MIDLMQLEALLGNRYRVKTVYDWPCGCRYEAGTGGGREDYYPCDRHKEGS